MGIILDGIVEFLNLNSGGGRGPYSGSQEVITATEELTNKVIIEKDKYDNMKRGISRMKVERIKLKTMNDELIKQGVAYLEIFKEKDVEIKKLQILIDKYEEALSQFEVDNKLLAEIAEKQKEKLFEFRDGKEKAVKALDLKSQEISRLKKINLQLLVELEKYKKD